MKGWKRSTLGQIAQIGTGNPAPQDAALFNGGIYPFFRTADAGRVRFGNIYEAKDNLNELGIKKLTRFPKGTILFPKSGASTFLNHRVMLGVDGYVSSHLATIISNEDEIDPKYLLYFLSTVAAQDLVQDHAYPSLNKGNISSIEVSYPGLAEQRRIGSVLDEAFVDLEVMRANTEKNIQNSRELFSSFLDEAVCEQKEGWNEKPLGEVCKFIGGSQPPKSSFSSDGGSDYVRLIQIRDYKTDKYTVFIPKREARRFCDETDVMIGRYGPPLFQILRGLNGAYNVALMKAAPNESVVSKDFLFFFLKNTRILNYITRSSERAAGQTGLNKEAIEPYPIPFPDLEQQAKVVKRLKELHSQQQELEALYLRKLAAINQLKQSVLQSAFSGKMSLAEAMAA